VKINKKANRKERKNKQMNKPKNLVQGDYTSDPDVHTNEYMNIRKVLIK